MKRNAWFRLYAEALDDPKVQRLHPTLFKAWVNLLCLACQHDGELPSNDDIAFRLRVSANDAQGYIDELILAGLIDILPNGKRAPHNWVKRQFVSDSSTSRVRKHRETKRKLARNADETLHETAPEQSRAETDTDHSTPLPPKRGPSDFDALKAFECWNQTALRCGLPQAAKLTPSRKRSIIARLKEFGPESWAKAMANIETSKFLTGDNPRGWRADLDFVCQAKSFARLIDGGYGNDRQAKAATPVRRVHDQRYEREAREYWARMDGMIQ